MDESGLSYVRLAPGKVASSLQLADDVIVDFTADGGVVGVEYLSAAAASRHDEYSALARSADIREKFLSRA